MTLTRNFLEEIESFIKRPNIEDQLEALNIDIIFDRSEKGSCVIIVRHDAVITLRQMDNTQVILESTSSPSDIMRFLSEISHALSFRIGKTPKLL